MSRSTWARRGRTPLVALAVVVVIALVLRPLLHEAPHPGGDNAAYVALASSLASGQGYTELWDPSARPHAKYPPVYPLLLATRVAAGADTWAELKTVTAALSLLLVLATFLWARPRVGVPIAAGVALLTGFSTGMLDYSRWVLSDVPFTAFTLLALWLAERAVARGDAASGVDDAAPPPALARLTDTLGRPRDWLWPAALALAGVAYFTRTAGLPLVVALLAVLALHRRWRPLLIGGGALAVAGLVWALRARAAGPGVPGEDYAGALWLLDPYDPGAGLAGPADLAGRLAANTVGYLTAHLPVGLVGTADGFGRALAVLVVVAGLVGWAMAAYRRRGVAELFLPLYAGLILLWPEVWSGDRFALPLIPLLLLYAAEALRVGIRRVAPVAVAGGLAAAGALLLLVQAGGYVELTRQAAACRGIVQVAGPYACFGQPVREFAEAARWAEANLPADASVLTRKPRIWYVLSGLPSRTYPFVDDTQVLLDAADDARARYVVLDFIGGQGMRFLAPAIVRRSRSFCVVAGFGGAEGRPGTQLLGILPTPAVPPAGAEEADGTLGPCPTELAPATTGGSGREPYSASSPIPILRPAS